MELAEDLGLGFVEDLRRWRGLDKSRAPKGEMDVCCPLTSPVGCYQLKANDKQARVWLLTGERVRN